jgi:hypothetical protein
MLVPAAIQPTTFRENFEKRKTFQNEMNGRAPVGARHLGDHQAAVIFNAFSQLDKLQGSQLKKLAVRALCTAGYISRTEVNFQTSQYHAIFEIPRWHS